MSAQAPITELPLFAPPPVERVKLPEVHARAETEHAAFFERVRRLVGGIFGGTQMEISADEVRRVMDQYGIDIPAGASPNIMGSFFSGWDRAHATGRVIRSKRPDGNRIATWTIE